MGEEGWQSQGHLGKCTLRRAGILAGDDPSAQGVPTSPLTGTEPGRLRGKSECEEVVDDSVSRPSAFWPNPCPYESSRPPEPFSMENCPRFPAGVRRQVLKELSEGHLELGGHTEHLG